MLVCLPHRPLAYLHLRLTQAVEERVDEVKLPLEDELAATYAGRQEEKALRESDRRCVSYPVSTFSPDLLTVFDNILHYAKKNWINLLSVVFNSRTRISQGFVWPKVIPCYHSFIGVPSFLVIT